MALAGGKLPALNDDEWVTCARELCTKARAEAGVGNGDVIAVEASGVESAPFADAHDLKKVETVKGTITTVGSVQVGTVREERVRLRVRTTEGREVIVYAAPATCAEQEALGLCPGRTVEVTGSPAKDGTQTVLVAGVIAAGGKTARLRDDQGRVTWTKR